MSKTVKTTQYYELSFLFSSDLTDEQATDFLKTVADKIGKIEKTESLKRIGLVYPIKKKTEAFLATLEFETEKEKIQNLKAEIEKMPEILRFLLIAKKPVKETPVAKEKPRGIKAKLEERPTIEKPVKKTKTRSKTKLDELEQDLEKILDFSSEDKL